MLVVIVMRTLLFAFGAACVVGTLAVIYHHAIRVRHAIVLALLLSIGATVSAADKHAPLPEKLLSAKTAYIDNQSGSAKFADQFYSELSKTSRFAVVTAKTAADVVMRLSCRRNINSGSPCGYTQLDVIDQNGDVLWSESATWNLTGRGPKTLAKRLRERLAE